MRGNTVQTDDVFLVTQFAAPRPPFGMVERKRLSMRLRTGTSQPVTLVCAPAGSGKTSLLSSVLGESTSSPAAWLSLEPGDDAPERFWRGVLRALRAAGIDLPSMAAPVRDSAEDFPLALVNALAELRERVLLVLDDVHEIRSRECLGQLSFLLLHMPPTLAVVLGTRSDPPLPLHLLRVRGQLTEIRASDLAFTTAEATSLLAAHDVELTEPLVAALCGRTEGWAAGLRLAALGLHGSNDAERYIEDFTGSDAVVGDYLVAEVLERWPAKVRRFLLETSILDCLNGDLADAVTGTTGGADTLEALERANAFVLGLDRRRQWFRYHSLLAALLRARARRELVAELDELHRRAAQWYAGHGMPGLALQHALEGDDPGLGLQIIGACWFELLVSGRYRDILALVDRLPSDRVASDTEIAAIAACAAFAAGDEPTAEAHRENALAGAAHVDDDKRSRFMDALTAAELCAARAAADVERALTAARDARAHDRSQAFVHACVGEAALWSHRLDTAEIELLEAVTHAREGGLDRLAVSSLGQLALCEALNGETGGVLRHAREALALADHEGFVDDESVAPAHLALALIALSEMRSTEAEAHVGTARSLRVPRRGFDALLAHTEAELHELLGHPERGLNALDRFETSAPASAPTPYERALLGSARARLHVGLGELDAARVSFDEIADESWLMVAVARAQLLLAEGDPATAAEALEQAPDRSLLERTRIERAVLYAVALDQAREPERAARAFGEALERAEPSDHRWAFLTIRSRVQNLLRDQVRSGTRHRVFVGQLLEAFANPDRPRTSMPALLEPLTAREQAVLRFLPTRLSNHEVASELFISTNTVKTHLRSIYRKLDVERRDEAVARARELNLLASSRR